MTILELQSDPERLPEWFSRPCIMGIDEAGRGPVLGPMVYACALCPLEDEAALKKQGFDDSKQLTPEKRNGFYKQLDEAENIVCLVNAAIASEISSKMLSRNKTSLNEIAVKCTMDLIDWNLAQGANIKQIYIDTVGDSQSYQNRLNQHYSGISFTVCPKADSLYPIVSAASIAAKVWRDKALENDPAVKCDIPAGSGYPSDKVTKEWLEKTINPVFGWNKLVRYSWSTCITMMDQQCSLVKWQADDVANTGCDQTSVSSIFPKVTGHSLLPNKLKHNYYKSRSIVRTVDW